MSLLTMIGFGSNGISQTPSTEIPNIFPIGILQADFVAVDVKTIYSRILTDVFERTSGLKEEQIDALSDNCLASESKDGLISMLADAMLNKADLFIVWDTALKFVRKATREEQETIKADYKARGESSVGVYVTFKNFKQADMIKFYSAIEYCTVGSLYKLMNLSKAVQIKPSDIRASVATSDASIAIEQGKLIAKALSEGKDVMLDAKDIIEMLKADLEPTNKASEFVAKKQSLYLGLPASYILGSTSGSSLGDTGQGEAKAVERGLKGYFSPIVKPVCKKLFGVDLTFKSENYDQIASSLEVLKTFEITGEELISAENKRIIINNVFGLPEDSKGDPPKKVEAPPVTPGVVPERDVTPKVI